MDNQQERRIVASAWLAGLIDADGCFTFQSSIKSGRGNIQHQPLADIATSCSLTVDVIRATLKMLNIGCWISPRYKDRSTVQIRIAGFKRLGKLLKFITPYLITKRKEAVLIQRWIKLRTRKQSLSKPYSKEEIEIYESIKAEKTNRILRDYTPNILWLQGEDIVQPTLKDDR